MSELAIELSNINVRRQTTHLLQDVSWSLPSGCDAAILGPNGSGKSTLARVILGYLWPTSGQVRVLGNKYGEVDLSWLRTQIKFVQAGGSFELDPQLSLLDIALTGWKSTMVLRFDPKADEIEQARAMLRIVGLERLAERRYGQASSGERVRAQIARALVTTPKILLLDEPTAGLDILGRESLLDLTSSLREQTNAPDLTIVTITHHTEELFANTRQVLLLDGGRVAASGSMSDVLCEKTLSAVYQVPITVHCEAGRYYTHVRGNVTR